MMRSGSSSISSIKVWSYQHWGFSIFAEFTSLMEEFLDEILWIVREGIRRTTRPRGTKEYYKDKMSGKNVLVGALSKKPQLEVL